jgi:GNAT superfamily N-acetyltransferase
MFTSHGVSPDWVAALRNSQGADPWRHGFFLLHRAAGTVIGTAGFKGPADPQGTVEIAYGIAPSYQSQGYATEAAAALVAFAFHAPGVALVCAHAPRPHPGRRSAGDGRRFRGGLEARSWHSRLSARGPPPHSIRLAAWS